MGKLLLTIIAVLCIHFIIYAEDDCKYVNKGSTITRYNSLVKMYNRYIKTKDKREIASLIKAVNLFDRYLRSTPSDITINQRIAIPKQFNKLLGNVYERQRQIEKYNRQIAQQQHKEKVRIEYERQQKEIAARELKQKIENEKRITEDNHRKRELKLRKAQQEFEEKAQRKLEERSRIAKLYETLSTKYKMNGIAVGGLKKFLRNMIDGEDVSGYKNKLFICSDNSNKKFRAFSRGQGITLYATKGGGIIIAIKGNRLIPNNARLSNKPMIYIGLYEYKTTIGGSNVVPAFVIAE